MRGISCTCCSYLCRYYNHAVEFAPASTYSIDAYHSITYIPTLPISPGRSRYGPLSPGHPYKSAAEVNNFCSKKGEFRSLSLLLPQSSPDFNLRLIMRMVSMLFGDCLFIQELVDEIISKM